ncbi:uncharacterized protein [Emydura macquarii macquarii]|uniref:uncharacterized protein isoform X1 n=1 Tax=Emydura macquarii macquarii TaxID=1129001 RepID=UPI00352BAEEA
MNRRGLCMEERKCARFILWAAGLPGGPPSFHLPGGRPVPSAAWRLRKRQARPSPATPAAAAAPRAGGGADRSEQTLPRILLQKLMKLFQTCTSGTENRIWLAASNLLCCGMKLPFRVTHRTGKLVKRVPPYAWPCGTSFSSPLLSGPCDSGTVSAIFSVQRTLP